MQGLIGVSYAEATSKLPSIYSWIAILLRKCGVLLFWIFRSLLSLRLLFLIYSPLGAISILIASPSNLSGIKFGQLFTNLFAGNSGWPVMIRSLMDFDIPLFRSQLKLKPSSWKQCNSSFLKKIHCSYPKKGDGFTP